jgi:hypothetical protein
MLISNVLERVKYVEIGCSLIKIMCSLIFEQWQQTNKTSHTILSVSLAVGLLGVEQRIVWLAEPSKRHLSTWRRR